LNHHARRSTKDGSLTLQSIDIDAQKNPFTGARRSLISQVVVQNGVEVSNPAYLLKKFEQKERKVQFDI